MRMTEAQMFTELEGFHQACRNWRDRHPGDEAGYDRFVGEVLRVDERLRWALYLYSMHAFLEKLRNYPRKAL
jgi:hypothetical protein